MTSNVRSHWRPATELRYANMEGVPASSAERGLERRLVSLHPNPFGLDAAITHIYSLPLPFRCRPFPKCIRQCLLASLTVLLAEMVNPANHKRYRDRTHLGMVHFAGGRGAAS